MTLPPHPSPYPLTSARVGFFTAEIALGVLLGALALGRGSRQATSAMRPEGERASRALSAADGPMMPSTTPVRERGRVGGLATCYTASCTALLLGVVVLACAGIDVLSNGAVAPVPPRIQEASRNAYLATVPGLHCDHSGAYWVQDPREGYECQADGLLITQKYFDYQAESYFAFVSDDRSNDVFAAHRYRVEVRATIVSGGPGTCVGLHVHIQDFQGRQTFFACDDGTWDIGRCDLHCDHDMDLMSGTLPAPARSFLLSVEVTDGAMAFDVNGAIVAILQDGTYSSTNQLALGLYGPHNPATPPAALFSDFRYIPLS